MPVYIANPMYVLRLPVGSLWFCSDYDYENKIGVLRIFFNRRRVQVIYILDYPLVYLSLGVLPTHPGEPPAPALSLLSFQPGVL